MTKRFAGAALALGALLAGCNSDELLVPNYNNPTSESIGSDPAAIQFAINGILGQNRQAFAATVSQSGILGRESYNYTGTEARNHSHFVAQNPLDPAGFAVVPNWAGRYRNLRNLFNLGRAIEGAASLPEPQKQAARGFIGTMYALELSYIVHHSHNAGAVVEVLEDVQQSAPFVSRDSVYNAIVARLNEAYTQLQAGGSTFPFTLHAGFRTNGSFDTPTTFARVNRAIAARVEVLRASLRNPACGANGVTCYNNALTALSNSFIDPAGNLNLGVYHIYSAESGDQENTLNASVGPDLLAHPSITTDPFETKAGGARDDRITAKIRTLPSARGLTGGITTTAGFQLYGSNAAPVPWIRNEELILLRAEARYFTGDQAGALADINTIRTRSGGIAARGAFTSATGFIDELLAQRRLSLLWEGHRWADVRRFDRLTQLPRDLASHFIHLQQPIPQAECLFRQTLAENLRCPTLTATAVAP